MSRRRAYSDDTLSVIGRFFQALDALIEGNVLRGVNTYCRLHGIDKRHLMAQKADIGRGYFEVSWLLPMITSYNVSANWLLLGKGVMFRKGKGADSLPSPLNPLP